MSYDFDLAPDRFPPAMGIQPTRGDDLETIVTLLQLAAIFLTSESDTTFTAEDLFREACSIGSGEISLDTRDIQIVLDTGCPGITNAGAQRFRLA